MRLPVLLLPLLLAASSTPGTSDDHPTAWLAGCWRMSRGPVTIDEQWLVPRAGMMLGTARTVKGDQVLEYEFVVIRAEAGGVSYEAHPSGQDIATFRSPSLSGGADVVFRNPEHDFPQVVGYRRAGRDSVVAWIEGTQSGKTKKIEFPYARVSCGS